MSEPEKKKQPLIGFAGLGMIALSALVCFLSNSLSNSVVPGVIVFAIGAVILVYALITGNIKFLG